MPGAKGRLGGGNIHPDIIIGAQGNLVDI